jgi:hypothetical protein
MPPVEAQERLVGVDPVGFANSGGLVFVDESAKKIATT